MNRKKYYGVAGDNGYGVYNRYDKVLESKPFITRFKLKGFRDFDEAKVFALNTYEELQDETIGQYQIEELDKQNWFYRRELIDDKTESKENTECAAGYAGQRIKPFSVGIS